jgi:peptide chain release factor 1
MQYSDKLDHLEKRFEELTSQMADPSVIADNETYRKTAKMQRDMELVVGKYREYKVAAENLQQAQGMLLETDAEMRAMAEEEIASLTPQIVVLEEELKFLLLPKDPNDERNVVMEIRAGTGGDEATLFANEVFRMYTRYAETLRW